MEDLSNIWNADDELNEDELLNYVNSKSVKEDAHNFERKMAGSSFINDSVEGLQQFSSAEKINAYVHQINSDLHQKLVGKKSKHKRGISNLSWEIIAVIAVILLCLLGYVVIEMMHK
ncbi:MAG: hypothetical protein JO072_01830 [Parafilimonas sp.]|nr:hypothetical protein [Parafilimonas sp.]